jgi:hypothetical protein
MSTHKHTTEPRENNNNNNNNNNNKKCTAVLLGPSKNRILD